MGSEAADAFLDIRINFREPGNAYHMEDLFEVVGKTCDRDLLSPFPGLRKDLDHNGYAAAVDVSLTLEYQKQLFGIIFGRLSVGLLEKRLGSNRKVTLDGKERDRILD